MADPTAPEPHDGPRWTDAFARLVLARPRAILVVSALLAVLGGAIGWLRLPLDANTDSLISPNRPWMKDYLGFLAEFGDLEYVYVVVDSRGDRAAGERAVDDLLARLRGVGDLAGVYGRIEPEEIWRLSTRAMTVEDLRGLVDASDAFPILATRSADAVLRDADSRLARLMSPEGTAMPQPERIRLGAAALFELDIVSTDQSADASAYADSLARRPTPRYLDSDTGRLLFVGIQPRKDFSTLAAIEGPMGEIRSIIAQVRAAHPDVEIGLTGKPVLQADELITSTGDTTKSFAAGLTIVAILCVVIYRDWRRPLLALLAFAVAIGWTQGAAALLVGRLTLLSMVFMLVLIGAGLDYAIHIVSRYTEFRATCSVADSVRRTLHTTAVGTMTGAATSAAVFVLAIFSSFGGLRELGIIAGAGLVLCALAMVTALPALLVTFDALARPRAAREFVLPGNSIARRRGRAIATVAIFAALLFGAIVSIPLGLRFESNLLKLQSPSLESVQWEHRVLEDSASLSWFAGVICDSETQVLETIEKAQREPRIGFVRSLFDLVQPSSPERDGLRAAFTEAVARADDVQPAPVETIEPARWHAAAVRLGSLALLARAQATPEELAHMQDIRARLEAMAKRAATEPEAVSHDAEMSVTNAWSALTEMAAGDRATIRDALPAAVRARFVSPQGRYLVHLVPKGDAWEYEPLRAFVEAIRRVDPHATGVPITQSESILDMFRAFVSISLLSVVAVSLLTWLDFRRLSAVALCTGVLLVGITLTLGILAVARVPLSLANFFGVPILIGLGIDSGIHLLHRADETRRKGEPLDFGGTRSAVIFTSLTTAIGFGGQIFASHRGMQGLGWIIVIGSLVCLATSVWLLPAILCLVRRADAAAPRVTGSG